MKILGLCNNPSSFLYCFLNKDYEVGREGTSERKISFIPHLHADELNLFTQLFPDFPHFTIPCCSVTFRKEALYSFKLVKNQIMTYYLNRK